ncbi:MAG: phenylacetate--CoA ligase family protein [Candidatus Merdivicinus sp.]|jgi:phenylacetate-CoA ligase
MGKFFNEKMETMSRDEMLALQGERLADTVRRVYDHVAPYRAKMDAAGIKPEDIRTVEDLAKLPFTTKQDLRDNYPYGMFALPPKEIAEIHASSGTTGKQTVVGYSAADLETWGEIAARAIVAAGGDKDDYLHVSYGYGLFTGGLGLHYGGQKMGASVIPVSAGNTKRQIQIMQDFGSTILACTPSYALYLGETVCEMGVQDKIHLKAGIFGAEPWTEEMRREIEQRLNIKAHDIYGLSEIMGPGVSFECEEQTGMHVNEDHFIVEIIDPDTGEVLPDGSEGELVFTCITKQALPLIRYRTRDISKLSRKPCSCGRTLVKMEKPRGRSDDMLIIRGVNVFPSQVEAALLQVGTAGTAPYYQLIVDRINNLDTLEVQVEMDSSFFSDTVRGIEEQERKIAKQLDFVLGLSAKVTLVEPKSLARSEGKAVRVIDKRKLHD